MLRTFVAKVTQIVVQSFTGYGLLLSASSYTMYCFG
jgi:hypothetical protein